MVNCFRMCKFAGGMHGIVVVFAAFLTWVNLQFNFTCVRCSHYFSFNLICVFMFLFYNNEIMMKVKIIHVPIMVIRKRRTTAATTTTTTITKRNKTCDFI